MGIMLLHVFIGAAITSSTMLYVFNVIPRTWNPEKRIRYMLLIGLPIGIVLSQLIVLWNRLSQS